MKFPLCVNEELEADGPAFCNAMGYLGVKECDMTEEFELFGIDEVVAFINDSSQLPPTMKVTDSWSWSCSSSLAEESPRSLVFSLLTSVRKPLSKWNIFSHQTNIIRKLLNHTIKNQMQIKRNKTKIKININTHHKSNIRKTK